MRFTRISSVWRCVGCWHNRRLPHYTECGKRCYSYDSKGMRFSFELRRIQSWLVLRILGVFFFESLDNGIGFLLAAGDMVAIGSQNGSIYLFRVSRDGFTCKKLSKIRGSQPLVQLDWSSDNNFIQTVTADYDLSYCELTTSRAFNYCYSLFYLWINIHL